MEKRKSVLHLFLAKAQAEQFRVCEGSNPRWQELIKTTSKGEKKICVPALLLQTARFPPDPSEMPGEVRWGGEHWESCLSPQQALQFGRKLLWEGWCRQHSCLRLSSWLLLQESRQGLNSFADCGWQGKDNMDRGALLCKPCNGFPLQDPRVTVGEGRSLGGAVSGCRICQPPAPLLPRGPSSFWGHPASRQGHRASPALPFSLDCPPSPALYPDTSSWVTFPKSLGNRMPLRRKNKTPVFFGSLLFF